MPEAMRSRDGETVGKRRRGVGVFNAPSKGFGIWTSRRNKECPSPPPTGKGNIITSYVPFVQVSDEHHKERVRALIKDGRTVRVFYQSEGARSQAHDTISDIQAFMIFAAEDAKRVLSDEYASPSEQELAMKHLMYDDPNLNVSKIDTYSNAKKPLFGLDITERLFWESYVMIQDSSRRSEPAFVDTKLKDVRRTPEPDEPRAVYQYSKTHPMDPRTLLTAHEEYGKVKLVVSVEHLSSARDR